MFVKIKREILAFIYAGLMLLPTSRVGNWLRRKFVRASLGRGDAPVSVFRNVTITGYENLSLGSNVTLNVGVIVDAADGAISIGNDVSIGPYVVMRAADHTFEDGETLIRLQGHTAGRIDIGDDVWLGAHVTVLKDAKIGRGAVIGAGAVVTGEIPEYAVAVGTPAKVIKYRKRKQSA